MLLLLLLLHFSHKMKHKKMIYVVKFVFVCMCVMCWNVCVCDLMQMVQMCCLILKSASAYQSIQKLAKCLFFIQCVHIICPLDGCVALKIAKFTFFSNVLVSHPVSLAGGRCVRLLLMIFVTILCVAI